MPASTLRAQTACVLRALGYRLLRSWAPYCYAVANIALMCVWAVASLHNPGPSFEGLRLAGSSGLEAYPLMVLGYNFGSSMVLAAVFAMHVLCSECETASLRNVVVGVCGRTAFALASAVAAALASVAFVVLGYLAVWVVYMLHGVALTPVNILQAFTWLTQCFLLAASYALIVVMIELVSEQPTWAAAFAVVWLPVDGWVCSILQRLVPTDADAFVEQLSILHCMDTVAGGETLGIVSCLMLVTYMVCATAALCAAMRRKALA